MILHHFCWRSSKITLFWPKILIFSQKSRKSPNNPRNFRKFLGIPRDLCGGHIVFIIFSHPSSIMRPTGHFPPYKPNEHCSCPISFTWMFQGVVCLLTLATWYKNHNLYVFSGQEGVWAHGCTLLSVLFKLHCHPWANQHLYGSLLQPCSGNASDIK